MKVTAYPGAARFLANTEEALEANEAANSLMLGICRHLVRRPQQIRTAPCLRTVEDGGGLVLAAVMTPPYKLVVYGHRGDLAAATRLLVDDLADDGWRLPGVLGPKAVARQVAGRWAEVTGRAFRLEREQRVYELREVLVPPPQRGSLRPAGMADLELVTGWRQAFHTEIFGAADPDESRRATRSRIERGHIYLWEDGRPVSMAMKTRPTRQGISVSLVYTPAAWRRRGYATACVGELSRMLLEAGWSFCALFADVSNAASNRLYQRVGYRPACDYDEYRFESRAASRPAGKTPGNLRCYGAAPYHVAVVHGGPGAGGEMAPVARRLAAGRGVLEPIQTATSLPGQVAELSAVLEQHASLPATLIGFSWGAWLSVLVAAHHPALVGKLILVGSGPFEERYVARLQEARLSRLGERQRAEFEAILGALADPATGDRDRLLARLGALTSETDAYDPITEESPASDQVACRGDIFSRVWQEAAELRKSGALLELAGRLECPVLAIHGDHDPHPAKGVKAPLSAVVRDFRFFLLPRCGHKPWIERQAREAFYARLEEELPGPLETAGTGRANGGRRQDHDQ
jgi:predicted GNAT family acetyltransferase/pimeloyl-ACP methyl ester carboxylesterase